MFKACLFYRTSLTFLPINTNNYLCLSLMELRPKHDGWDNKIQIVQQLL